MYEFREVKPRIAYMRELIRNRVCRSDAERAGIATEAFKKYRCMIPAIRRAMVCKEVCEQATVRVEDFELIVGNIGKEFLGSGYNPEWGNTDWIVKEIENCGWILGEDNIWRNPPESSGAIVPMEVTDEDYHKIKEIAEFWQGNLVTDVGNAWAPDGFEEFVATGASQFPFPRDWMALPVGHLVAGYKKIITRGYKSIRDEAQAWLDEHEGNAMGQEIYQLFFYKAVTIMCDAATTLVHRYAQVAADKAAACEDPERKAELEFMADGLEHLSLYPARNFWEACQGIMMYQVALQMDASYPSPALGRFDQVVWPYLEKELEEGTLDLDRAQEIVDAFFLKVNCFYGGAPRFITESTGIGNSWQHTTIGGVKPEDGTDATNPVTYMVLETIARLKLHDPTISLRFNPNSPAELWRLAIETSKIVGGLPLYQNDEVIIPGLIENNRFSLEDARDYAFIGCQEIVGSGNDYPCGNGIVPPNAGLRYSVIITMAINDGINPMNGHKAKIGFGKLGDMKSFDEVKEAYRKMVEYFTKWSVTMQNFV
ncbi:MAG: pyruvate formate lyase family protein, partial [bacterium]|nr:pyruvate formate lyase family protein [bacterium]